MYVALACGINGLEGNATGASMSIDIAELDCSRIQKFNGTLMVLELR